MSGYKVEICGVNTAKLPLLTTEEKEELFKRILAGDKQAREDYIKGNLRLVLSVIQRFSGNNENVDDLFQIGCIGLIKAIDNFDITQNVRFSTYAVPMILGEVRRYLRDNNSIRVSRSLRDTAYKAIYARENLMKKNMKEPTIMEIADEVGLSKEEITYAMDAIQTPMSLYEPVYTDGGDPLYVMDQISDKKNREENWIEQLSLNEAMKRLPDRERNIIRMRFYEGRTQTEVAEEVGISQAQVSRLEKNALKTMRSYLACPFPFFYTVSDPRSFLRTASSDGMLGIPPGVSVDRLAAADAKAPMAASSFSSSSSGAFPDFKSQATALPPKISPAPVVSTGVTLGQTARAAAFSLDRYAPLGPMVTMESFTPNSFWSFSAAFSSSVIPQRNSTSSSLIFTTSAWESPQRICSLASSGVFHRGSRRFGSKVIHFPFFRAYSTARFAAVRTGSFVRLKVPK